jgi:exopolysaccharide biosynthesis WecB/TagA/CpsF family protein
MTATQQLGRTRRIYGWRDILGIPVAVMTMPQALDFLEQRISERRHTPVAFLNANNANIALALPEMKRALGHFLTLSDGVGVDLASRTLHGAIFPANLNGTDLVPGLLKQVKRPLRVGLLGARREVVEQALKGFSQLCPHHQFTLYADGFFKPHEEDGILSRLAADRPDVLLVAMGVPRQELWIERRITGEHCTVPMAVGALFDLLTGAVPRAPQWMLKVRIEWVYRLWREPKRLWRRYLIGNPKFMFAVVKAYLSGTSKGHGSPSEGSEMRAGSVAAE